MDYLLLKSNWDKRHTRTYCKIKNTSRIQKLIWIYLLYFTKKKNNFILKCKFTVIEFSRKSFLTVRYICLFYSQRAGLIRNSENALKQNTMYTCIIYSLYMYIYGIYMYIYGIYMLGIKFYQVLIPPLFR